MSHPSQSGVTGWRPQAFLPIVLLAVCALGGCSERSEPGTVTTELSRPPVWRLEVGSHPLEVELALTSEEQQRGLMYRTSLDATHGMLFIYDDEARRGFYMKNTYVPLAIAFIDRDRVIRDIREMKPLDENTVWSGRATMYVLEANRGWFAARGITPGTKVTFSPELEERLKFR